MAAVQEQLSSKDLPPNTSPYMPNIFLKTQFCISPVYPPAGTDLTGRTALITGANTGLGLECSRQLLSYGLSRIILAVRSPTKGENAATQLRVTYPTADIQVWPLDMASYPSIRTFVHRVSNHLDRVDYVVLNAGVWKHFAIVSSTGHEETFQVNYLSQALLTFLLLPVLKVKAAPGSPARLTWVNSGLAFTAKFPQRKNAPLPLFATFSQKEGFDSQEAYCSSKLLAHYFLWELAERVSADHVIVSIADPGYVRGTGLMDNTRQELAKKNAVLGAVAGGFIKVFERAGRTLEAGTSALVDAVVNHGAESHGCLLMSWKISP